MLVGRHRFPQNAAMSPLDVSVQIAAPQERVFAAVSDFGKAADRVEAIVKCEVLTEGEIGVGTRFRETRKMFKKEHSEEMEVTGFDPPNSFTLAASSCGAEYTTIFSVQSEGEGSELSMSFTSKPVKLMAKLMAPMFFFMKGSMRKMMQADLESIKCSIEADAG